MLLRLRICRFDWLTIINQPKNPDRVIIEDIVYDNKRSPYIFIVKKKTLSPCLLYWRNSQVVVRIQQILYALSYFLGVRFYNIKQLPIPTPALSAIWFRAILLHNKITINPENKGSRSIMGFHRWTLSNLSSGIDIHFYHLMAIPSLPPVIFYYRDHLISWTHYFSFSLLSSSFWSHFLLMYFVVTSKITELSLCGLLIQKVCLSKLNYVFLISVCCPL